MSASSAAGTSRFVKALLGLGVVGAVVAAVVVFVSLPPPKEPVSLVVRELPSACQVAVDHERLYWAPADRPIAGPASFVSVSLAGGPDVPVVAPSGALLGSRIVASAGELFFVQESRVHPHLHSAPLGGGAGASLYELRQYPGNPHENAFDASAEHLAWVDAGRLYVVPRGPSVRVAGLALPGDAASRDVAIEGNDVYVLVADRPPAGGRETVTLLRCDARAPSTLVPLFSESVVHARMAVGTKHVYLALETSTDHHGRIVVLDRGGGGPRSFASLDHPGAIAVVGDDPVFQDVEHEVQGIWLRSGIDRVVVVRATPSGDRRRVVHASQDSSLVLRSSKDGTTVVVGESSPKGLRWSRIDTSALP